MTLYEVSTFSDLQNASMNITQLPLKCAYCIIWTLRIWILMNGRTSLTSTASASAKRVRAPSTSNINIHIDITSSFIEPINSALFFNRLQNTPNLYNKNIIYNCKKSDQLAQNLIIQDKKTAKTSCYNISQGWNFPVKHLCGSNPIPILKMGKMSGKMWLCRRRGSNPGPLARQAAVWATTLRGWARKS